MQEVIKDVKMQKGTGLLPFQGMDRASQPRALASPGKFRPFHTGSGGLYKKGDPCKFLHQCDLTRMPECCFYSRVLGFSGDCSSNECPFLHVKRALKSRDCPWSPGLCKYCHVPRIMCLNYLVGFCPKGPKCQFAQ
uniref:Cleavage and polyadenylation specificity factor subunit 4 n=1 Tax=Cebus imitator TaxID=2715852 RepID=A0A2K5RBQ8_CEBIM